MYKLLNIGILVLLLSCKDSDRIKRFQDQQLIKIAVIPMGSSHTYWTKCRDGALKAGKELDVEIVWQGPQIEDDALMQINVFNTIIQNGIDAIVLAPIDGKIMKPSMELAQKRQIPVISIDSETEDSFDQGFVGTENFNAGKLCGEKMVKLLNEKGKVVVFQLRKSVPSTRNRENGFLDVIENFPGIQVLKTDFFAGPTSEIAEIEAVKLLNLNPDLDGIFTVNESSTVGMMLALRKLNLNGKKHFIGFDNNPKVVDALRLRELDALAIQNPYLMGYIGVKNAYAAIKGEAYKKKVDTKISLINQDSLVLNKVQKF